MGLTRGSFNGQAPHLVHEASGTCVWFVEPFGMLTQSGEVRQASVEFARFLAGDATEALLARQRGAKHPARLLFLHDWTRFIGYHSAARKVLIEWGVAMRSVTERVVVAASPSARVVRMAVAVGSVALQVAGVRLDVVNDLGPVLARLDVRPQPP